MFEFIITILLAAYIIGIPFAYALGVYWVVAVRAAKLPSKWQLLKASLRSWYVVYLFIVSYRQLKK